MSAFPAHADVIYKFTSDVFNVKETVNAPQGTVVETGDYWGGARGANLTFSAPLAANSTTGLHYSPLNFLDPTKQHGTLTGYSTITGLYVLKPITSDIFAYESNSSASTLGINNYSYLDGTISTDANGNIVSWDLKFRLDKNGGNSMVQLD